MVESAREFEAEVSLLSQLDHPGIVKLEDFFFEQGRVYVVLEHIDGQSLRQRVQENGPLSEAEVVRIGKSICTVLEYLHGGDPPIVHRDITPENILITAAGDVKVIDFSLAVRQDGRQTTGSCAKQCFTPPEQFREEVTLQSDLYSLGATLYYLLTGSTPKPISCSSPKQKAAQVSSELSAIVERATKLDLKDRYETAAWLKLDLDQLK
jgi:serine/threonine-protein kinase